MNKSYTRKYLRAPYKADILFADDGFVFKARTMNLSEGGMLVDQIPHLPSKDIVPFIITIPYYPEFKNYSLERLRAYAPELFPSKVIRVKGSMLKRDDITTSVDQVFRMKFGVQFIEISPFNQKVVAEYVEIFTSNLIHLQKLIESSAAFADALESARVLAKILGYPGDIKLATLRSMVSHDYKSLQWL